MASGKQQINLRIDPDDRVLFDQAASAQHETLTQFLVESGRERAERLIADRTHFVLGSEEWEQLMEALDRPPQANPGLVDLFSRPRPE